MPKVKVSLLEYALPFQLKTVLQIFIYSRPIHVPDTSYFNELV